MSNGATKKWILIQGPRRRVLVAKLTRQRLKRGVFTSIVELQTAINRFIADANGKPKPFATSASWYLT
jgi:hypothetical protein